MPGKRSELARQSGTEVRVHAQPQRTTHDRAAGERASHRTETVHAVDRTEHAASFCRSETIRDDRRDYRLDAAGTERLDDASGDEHPQRRRKRANRRSEAEQEDAHDEYAFAPADVGETTHDRLRDERSGR